VTLFSVRNSGCPKGCVIEIAQIRTTLPHSRTVELGLAGGRVSFYFWSKTI